VLSRTLKSYEVKTRVDEGMLEEKKGKVIYKKHRVSLSKVRIFEVARKSADAFFHAMLEANAKCKIVHECLADAVPVYNAWNTIRHFWS
jgi:predicted TIM-barrel enzyme